MSDHLVQPSDCGDCGSAETRHRWRLPGLQPVVDSEVVSGFLNHNTSCSGNIQEVAKSDTLTYH